MRFHRFIISQKLEAGVLHIGDPGIIHQWSKVLRLQKGDTVVLCDGKGFDAEAVIESLGKTSATVTVAQVRKVPREPDRRVTLCLAILKRENFEWAVQKSTEVGVAEIIPIVSARTVKTGLKMDRLRAIAKEAVEQCGRGVVPVIREPVEFGKAVGRMKGRNILFHVDLCHPELVEGCFDAAQHDKNKDQQVTLWIGPEGGWTEDEVQLAKNAGAEIGSLGLLTLRAETAAVVGTYMACIN